MENRKNKKIYRMLLMVIVSALISCKKQLDVKPNSAIQVPVTAADFQALMDYTTVFSVAWPFAGTVGADDGFVTDATWLSATLTPRNAYIWNRDVFNDLPRNDWSYAYTAIFYANVVLEGTAKYGQATVEWRDIKGQAAFFRGYAYWQLAQEFCKPLDEQSPGAPGLVLRSSSDPNQKSVRSNLAQTYQQIISDLVAAAHLLPVEVLIRTRPGKAAAYAMLARTYMGMRDYTKAGLYADSSLQLNSKLLDYNLIASTGGPPFKRFNDEVLLHTTLISAPFLQPAKYLVDTTLYQSYSTSDLRKRLFFRAVSGTVYVSFNGSYDGTANLFNGPATDEMYLVRAEASVRSGKIDAALNDLNFLRKKRYVSSTYQPLSSGNTVEVLGWIITERRKELLLRGLRWADLRRLNREVAYAKTLVKMVDGKRYELPPDDPRYVWPIPQEVISDTGIQQN